MCKLTKGVQWFKPIWIGRPENQWDNYITANQELWYQRPEENWMSLLQWKKQICPSFAFSTAQAYLDCMMYASIGEGRSFFIQSTNFYSNLSETPSQTHRDQLCSQSSGNTLAQSSWHINLTISFLVYLCNQVLPHMHKSSSYSFFGLFVLF
jgi:hypothetical protein